MNTVKLLALFAQNKLGLLSRVTEVLAKANLNIRWITIATTESFGVVKLLINQCEEALQTLKQNGFTVSLIEVLALDVQDQPGSLHTVVKHLADNDLNVENASGFVANNRAIVLIEVHDLARARQILQKKHLHLLSQEEVMTL